MAVYFYGISATNVIASMYFQASSYCSSQDSQLAKSHGNFVSPGVYMECCSTVKANQKE